MESKVSSNFSSSKSFSIPSGKDTLGAISSCSFGSGGNAEVTLECTQGTNGRSYEVDFYCNETAGVFIYDDMELIAKRWDFQHFKPKIQHYIMSLSGQLSTLVLSEFILS